jgi:hypothetical protein
LSSIAQRRKFAMLLKVMPALFARLSQPRRRASRALEPADMGTAFGMEQWLNECEPPDAPDRLAGPARRGMRWLPRWLKLGAARPLRS